MKEKKVQKILALGGKDARVLLGFQNLQKKDYLKYLTLW